MGGKASWSAAALLALMPALVVSAGPPLEQHQQDLAGIKQQIEAQSETLGTLKRREYSTLNALDTLDRNLDHSRGRQRQLERQRAELIALLGRNETSVTSLQKEQAVIRAQALQRMRHLYMLGELGYLRLLFSASDANDLVTASYVFRRLLADDARMLRRYSRQTRELSQQRSTLSSQQQELQKLFVELEGERRTYHQKLQQQKQILRSVRDQRRVAQQTVLELEEAANKMEELIKRLTTPGFKSDFADFKGTLPPPVTGRMASQFGSWMDRGSRAKLVRTGVEFLAKTGDPVRAVFAGKVIFAGWFTGYGKIAIVDHGDSYYSMSAHLSQLRVQQGDRVQNGTVIGEVGDTGSLQGPRLYFELRYRGQAFDPRPWFNPVKLRR